MIEQNIKKVVITFIEDMVKRGLVPSKEQIFDYLDYEFQNNWQCLTTKEKLISWVSPIMSFDFFKIGINLEEILIHSNRDVSYIYSDEIIHDSLLYTQSELNLSLEIQSLNNNIDWNEANPFVSFKTKINNKSIRLSLTHKSLSPSHSHKASIRFHNDHSYNLSTFFSNKGHQKEVEKLFSNKSNILISGATGSGKTSFISSLLSLANVDDHIFIIEDTLELNSPNPRTTRLLSKNKNGYSLKDYSKYALRMRPDRIVVGEIRSSEATPLILNANNGHKGLLSTLHANDAQSAPKRLSTLLCLYSGIQGISNDLAMELICSGIDYIIHLEKKNVVQVIKLLNYENGVIHYDDILRSDYEFFASNHSYAA